MKKFIEEFKAFLLRGNVLDLAVAVVIGAAFKAIIDALVADVINPIIGLVFSAESLDTKTATLGSCDAKTGECNGVIAYGHFFGQVINFVIIGLVLFLVIKTMTKVQSMRGEKAEEETEPSDEVKLLTEIRDSLVSRG